MTWLKSIRLSTLMFAMLLAYFVVHVFTGQQGLMAWIDMNGRSAGLEREAAELKAERALLEDRLARLKGPHGDRDYVEELAYRQLGFVGAGDVVVNLNGINPATARSASPMPVAVQPDVTPASALPTGG